VAKTPLPSPLVYGLLAVCFICACLATIAVWRSTRFYKGSKGYVYLARFWMLLQLFGQLPLAYSIHLLQQHPLS